MIVVEITPIPKPRMTRRDKWLNPPRKCVSAYWAFKDELNFQLARFGFERDRKTLFAKVVVAFPKSYTKKKMQSLDGMPHEQKPDTDNFIKAICDAMMKEDKKVHTVFVNKVWGYTPQIIFYETLIEMIVEGGFSGNIKKSETSIVDTEILETIGY